MARRAEKEVVGADRISRRRCRIASGHGLSEVRLEAGFIQVPLPYMRAQRRADIYGVTHSEEMTPWRLHTRYDRPIPRRIAEERGVPRELFGQVKMASVVEFALPRIPCTPSLRAEYFLFLVQHGVIHEWQLTLLPLVRQVNEWVATHHDLRLLRRPFRWRGLWPWLNGSIFCFGVTRRQVDYARALERVDRLPHVGSEPMAGNDRPGTAFTVWRSATDARLPGPSSGQAPLAP